MTQETIEVSSNGHEAKPPGGRPGLQNLLVSGEGGNSFDPMRELLTGSNNAAEWLPRSRKSAREIKRDTRLMSKWTRYTEGSVDLPRLIWWQDLSNVGVDGKAREEAIELAGNMASYAANYQRPMTMMDRANVMNGKENRAG